MSVPGYPAYKDSGSDWIGIIPTSWEVKPLKRVATLRTQRAEGRAFAVALENIESWSGRFIPADGTYEGDGTAFDVGDILFGKLRPYLAKAWLADKAGEAVGDFHVLRCNPLHYPEFIQKVILSREVISLIDGSTFGAKMPRASWDFMGMLPVPIPPPAEQTAIAAFLERETDKIDALVAEQERLTTLLKEKQQAIVYQAMSEGLNPRVTKRPSGFAVPAYIPSHWETLPLTRVVRKFVDYRGATPTKTDSGIPLITATQIKEGRIDHSLDPVFISEQEYATRMTRGFPEIGDVLLTTEAPLGEVARIEDERVAPGQRMILMKVERSKILKDFLFYHFRSAFGHNELWTRASGSTASGIRSDRLRGSTVLVPPLDEQKKIVDFIGASLAKFEGVSCEVDRQISLLKERRAALISAAVTGKVDVRGLGASVQAAA